MKRLLTTAALVAVGFALATPIFTAGTAHAIPAFTRQHKTECATCHTIFPELTEQGLNFYKNSFVWTEAKSAKAAKEPKGESKEYLILSSLPDYVPVPFGGTLNASYHDQLGSLYVKQGQRSQACASFRQATTLNPTLSSARRHLGQYCR